MSVALQRLAEEVVGVAESDPDRAHEIYAGAADDFRAFAGRRENASIARALAAKAEEFEEMAREHAMSRGPATADDFTEIEREHAEAHDQVGHLDDLEIRARRNQIHDRDRHDPRVSITPASITDKTPLGRQFRLKWQPTNEERLEGVFQEATLVFWQGEKTESQAVTVDVGVFSQPAAGTSCRPYVVVEYGADGYKNSVPIDFGFGTRLTVVGSYVSVLAGMLAPTPQFIGSVDGTTFQEFPVTAGIMTIGALMGTFAAPSQSDVTYTVPVGPLRSGVALPAPDTSPSSRALINRPVKAQALLPVHVAPVPRTSGAIPSVAGNTTQLDFLDANDLYIGSVVYATGAFPTIPLPNVVAKIRITNLGPQLATYQLPFRLAL